MKRLGYMFDCWVCGKDCVCRCIWSEPPDTAQSCRPVYIQFCLFEECRGTRLVKEATPAQTNYNLSLRFCFRIVSLSSLEFGIFSFNIILVGWFSFDSLFCFLSSYEVCCCCCSISSTTVLLVSF